MENELKFHHIGIACNDINQTATEYEFLGYNRGDIVVDPLQNIKICFLKHPELPCIELLAPVNDASPVVQILKKNGTTPYHQCFETDNLEATIEEFKKNGYLIVSKAKPASAMCGLRVAFMFKPATGLIEFAGK